MWGLKRTTVTASNFGTKSRPDFVFVNYINGSRRATTLGPHWMPACSSSTNLTLRERQESYCECVFETFGTHSKSFKTLQQTKENQNHGVLGQI